MTKKKWIVTLAVAMVLVAALGTTVAFAADDDSDFGRGIRRWVDGGERIPYSEEWLADLVEDGVITQEQADSILAGDAHLYDFVSPEDCEEYGLLGEYGMYGHGDQAGYMYSEEWIAGLVDDGVITQEQADSILAGEAHLYDFVDPDTCPGPVFEDDDDANSFGRMPRGRGMSGRGF